MKRLRDMSRDEILELQPGFEIDWLVAQEMQHGKQIYATFCDNNGNDIVFNEHELTPFAPSTDEDDTIFMLEEGLARCNWDGGQWTVIIYHGASIEQQTNKSFCLAACRAFLMWRRKLCKYFGIEHVPDEFQDEYCAFCPKKMSEACYNEFWYQEAKTKPCFGEAGELNECDKCPYYDVCVDERGMRC